MFSGPLAASAGYYCLAPTFQSAHLKLSWNPNLKRVITTMETKEQEPGTNVGTASNTGSLSQQMKLPQNKAVFNLHPAKLER